MLKDQQSKVNTSNDDDDVNQNDVCNFDNIWKFDILENKLQKKIRPRSGVVSLTPKSERRTSNELKKVADSMSIPKLANLVEKVRKPTRKVSNYDKAFNPIPEKNDEIDGEGPIPYIEEKSLNQRLSAIEDKLTFLVDSKK